VTSTPDYVPPPFDPMFRGTIDRPATPTNPIVDYVIPVRGGYAHTHTEEDAAVRAAEPDAFRIYWERLADGFKGMTHHLPVTDEELMVA
jgi:hypothetical protein